MKRGVLCAWLLVGTVVSANAGSVVVENAAATRTGTTWRFDVTVRHADTGWKHYADAWRVIGPDGSVLGERTLYHPHVDEQPFTRSLTGVAIPAGVEKVRIEAHDKKHGWGSQSFELQLP